MVGCPVDSVWESIAGPFGTSQVSAAKFPEFEDSLGAKFAMPLRGEVDCDCVLRS